MFNVPTIFATSRKKGHRPKLTIFKHVSDNINKCLSVGNFGILPVVVCLQRVYSLHQLIQRPEIFAESTVYYSKLSYRGQIFDFRYSLFEQFENIALSCASSQKGNFSDHLETLQAVCAQFVPKFQNLCPDGWVPRDDPSHLTTSGQRINNKNS